jgi:hypothetical protein
MGDTLCLSLAYCSYSTINMVKCNADRNLLLSIDTYAKCGCNGRHADIGSLKRFIINGMWPAKKFFVFE